MLEGAARSRVAAVGLRAAMAGLQKGAATVVEAGQQRWSGAGRTRWGFRAGGRAAQRQQGAAWPPSPTLGAPVVPSAGSFVPCFGAV